MLATWAPAGTIRPPPPRSPRPTHSPAQLNLPPPFSPDPPHPAPPASNIFLFWLKFFLGDRSGSGPRGGQRPRFLPRRAAGLGLSLQLGGRGVSWETSSKHPTAGQARPGPARRVPLLGQRKRPHQKGERARETEAEAGAAWRWSGPTRGSPLPTPSAGRGRGGERKKAPTKSFRQQFPAFSNRKRFLTNPLFNRFKFRHYRTKLKFINIPRNFLVHRQMKFHEPGNSKERPNKTRNREEKSL